MILSIWQPDRRPTACARSARPRRSSCSGSSGFSSSRSRSCSRRRHRRRCSSRSCGCSRKASRPADPATGCPILRARHCSSPASPQARRSTRRRRRCSTSRWAVPRLPTRSIACVARAMTQMLSELVLAAKMLFDVDRAIDLYGLGTHPTAHGEAELRAAAYGVIIRTAATNGFRISTRCSTCSTRSLDLSDSSQTWERSGSAIREWSKSSICRSPTRSAGAGWSRPLRRRVTRSCSSKVSYLTFGSTIAESGTAAEPHREAACEDDQRRRRDGPSESQLDFSGALRRVHGDADRRGLRSPRSRTRTNSYQACPISRRAPANGQVRCRGPKAAAARAGTPEAARKTRPTGETRA